MDSKENYNPNVAKNELKKIVEEELLIEAFIFTSDLYKTKAEMNKEKDSSDTKKFKFLADLFAHYSYKKISK